MDLFRALSLYLTGFLWSVGADVTCPTLFNFYPDKHDCTKFYRCVWGKSKLFHCPVGTRWSQALLTCDATSKVKCSKTPAAQITRDSITGKILHRYLPELEAPDFSVDKTIITHTRKEKEQQTQPPRTEFEFPDDYYKQYPEDYLTDSGFDFNQDSKDVDRYRSGGDGKYLPHLQYHSQSVDDARRPTRSKSGHLTTPQPVPVYPDVYDYYKTLDYDNGYPEPAYYSNVKKTPKVQNWGDASQQVARLQPVPDPRPQPKSESEPKPKPKPKPQPQPQPKLKSNTLPGFVDHKPVPDHLDSKQLQDLYDRWFPVYLAYDQSRYEDPLESPVTEKPKEEPKKNANWLSSDLFRAGYGYKRIYVKK